MLQTIQDFADEGFEAFMDKLESKLNETTISVQDTKYKVIKSRAEYQIRLITPEIAASIFNLLFNSNERYKQEDPLLRKPYLRIGMTLPRWRILASIFTLKALYIHKEDPNEELTRIEAITVDISKRLEALNTYETENRGFRKMTHAV